MLTNEFGRAKFTGQKFLLKNLNTKDMETLKNSELIWCYDDNSNDGDQECSIIFWNEQSRENAIAILGLKNTRRIS